MRKPVSVWTYKPWWCQPWSIVLTSVLIISGSWWGTRTIWITLGVAIPVLTWMGYFVWIYPRLVAQSGLLDSLAIPQNQSNDDG